MKSCFLPGLIVAIAFGNISAQDVPFPDEQTTAAAKKEQKTVLGYLLPALKSAEGVARIDYETSCVGENGRSTEFTALPHVEVQKSAVQSRGVTAVREIFKNDNRVTVNAENGLVRIKIGDPPTQILNTVIQVVKFDKYQRYDPIEALSVIISTPELEKAMKQLGLEVPLINASGGATMPEKGLPHLPPQLRNVTVEHALDIIARTFHGITTYGVCAGSDVHNHYFWFNFLPSVGE